MPKITASFKLNGHDLTADVVNAGNWFGKDAIDELADSEEFGHHIVVAEADLGDYDPETCEYSGSGKVIDTDWLSVHGCEGCAVPFACRYHGVGLPSAGILPNEFSWDDIDSNEDQ